MPFERYHMQTGDHPEIKAGFFLSGPQADHQILSEIRQLLDRPGIKSVSVIFNHGLGERITVYQPIKE